MTKDRFIFIFILFIYFFFFSQSLSQSIFSNITRTVIWKPRAPSPWRPHPQPHTPNKIKRFIIITKTRLYNFDPLKPHFYIVLRPSTPTLDYLPWQITHSF